MTNYIGNHPPIELYQYSPDKWDYINTGNPAVDTNPSSVGATWLNLTTGEEFVCTDVTVGANLWIGSLGSGTGYGLASGLLLSYGFEETGGVAADLTGNYDGTVSGTVVRTETGVVGNAYSADWNFTNKVRNLAVPSLGTSVCSIAAWVKLSPPTGLYTPTVICYGSSTYKRMCMVCTQTTGYAYLQTYDGATSRDLNSNFVIADGTWHHVVMVRNGTALEVFVDGVSVASSTASGTGDISAGTIVNIGNVNGSAANSDFLGQATIDQPSIWVGRALTVADALLLYRGGYGLAGVHW